MPAYLDLRRRPKPKLLNPARDLDTDRVWSIIGWCCVAVGPSGRVQFLQCYDTTDAVALLIPLKKKVALLIGGRRHHITGHPCTYGAAGSSGLVSSAAFKPMFARHFLHRIIMPRVSNKCRLSRSYTSWVRGALSWVVSRLANSRALLCSKPNVHRAQLCVCTQLTVADHKGTNWKEIDYGIGVAS